MSESESVKYNKFFWWTGIVCWAISIFYANTPTFWDWRWTVPTVACMVCLWLHVFIVNPHIYFSKKKEEPQDVWKDMRDE